MDHHRLRVDTAAERESLYLSLLYSTRLASEVESMQTCEPLSASARVFLAGVDRGRLRAELDYRRDDMARVLVSGCECLMLVLGAPNVDEMARRYCDAAAFWRPRGRTLVENFALWAHAELTAGGQGLAAEAVKFDGVCSGLTAEGGAGSPWSGHRNHRELAAEAYMSRYALVDPDGKRLGVDNVDQLRASRPGRLATIVALATTGGTVVQQRRMDARENPDANTAGGV